MIEKDTTEKWSERRSRTKNSIRKSSYRSTFVNIVERTRTIRQQFSIRNWVENAQYMVCIKGNFQFHNFFFLSLAPSRSSFAPLSFAASANDLEEGRDREKNSSFIRLSHGRMAFRVYQFETCSWPHSPIWRNVHSSCGALNEHSSIQVTSLPSNENCEKSQRMRVEKEREKHTEAENERFLN